MTNLNGAYRCPVCRDAFSDLHALALHIALKADEKHVLWRVGRHLPEKVTIKDRAIITQLKVELFQNISLVIGEQKEET